jgi:Fe-S-cluster-containing hydrogenase component 2
VGIYDNKPLFCDLCGGETSCVHSCPTGALSYRESEDIELTSFQNSELRAGQRRARYAEVEAEPVREEWAMGRRIDS